HKFPYEIWLKACELGFVGVHYPEEFGGQGYGVMENFLIAEEFCRKDSGLGSCLRSSGFGADVILRFGSDEQKKQFLTPLTTGKAISAGAFTEPDHGSDITSLNTVALRDGNEYVVNGMKTFITNGTYANFAIVLCQTSPEAQPPHRGQSLIIVELDRPGVDRTEVGEKMCLKMLSAAQLAFNDVRVPLDHVIGEENRGFYYAMEFFNETRVGIAAQALGIAQGAFDRALDYAKQRRQFGQRLADFQAIQHKLAEMATKLETARLITYRAAWGFDHGKPDAKLASMAKFYSARMGVEVCEEAIQILGGYGMLTENEVERRYRDIRVTEIYEGTREIQKTIIARALIGK
ncbi:MAG: acyl-CoA/acyl-ACP dehydrogenase, partial [Chloroflexi bacterium]|nr:acyl-CoA/acyl-ACP dehydrogenase [Chloroflexota bacterium]